MLTGQNGILNKAGEAKEKTEKSQQEELEKLAGMEALFNVNGYDYEDKKTKKMIKIPSGYLVSTKEGENSLEDGIVIKDSNGNEYVWVEVPRDKVQKKDANYNIANTTLTQEDYATIETGLEAYAAPYTEGKKDQKCNWKDEWYEGCGLTQEEYKRNKEKMLKSIYENGGFWISRYEIGDEKGTQNNKLRTNPKNPLTTPVSKQNQVPYVCVTCSQAQNLASKMAQGSTVTSSLLFGIQWDLVCKYLEGKNGLTEAKINKDSKTWGNYRDSEITLNRGKYIRRQSGNFLDSAVKWYNYNENITGWVENKIKKVLPDESGIILTTGASDDSKKQNIYDLAGNLWEWTLEHATSDISVPCVYRGGGHIYNGSIYPASYRVGGTSDAYGFIGCHVALY